MGDVRHRPSRPALGRSAPSAALACGLILTLAVSAGPARPDEAAAQTPETAGECTIRTVPAEWQVAEARPYRFERRARRLAPSADEELFRPISGEEAEELIRALEPVKLDKDKGWTVRAVIEGTKLSLERIGVLVGDVRAVIAQMHGEELLKDLKSQPDLKPEFVEWADRAFESLGPCTLGRFADRGGERALIQTREVGAKYRERLEPLVLEDLRRFGMMPR